MPNIFGVAARWTDNDGNSPPSYWSGTAYEFMASDNNAMSDNITATVNAGDTISFTLDIVVPATTGFGSTIEVWVNGDSVASWDAEAPGSYTYASSGLDPGDQVTVGVNSSYSAGTLYGGEFVFTPPLPAVPGPGFVLATGDTLSPSSGPGMLITLVLPALTVIAGAPASYVRAPWGAALVFYGNSPVYSLPLPEDVGLPAYKNAPKQQYVWRSKKFVFPGQTTMGACKIVHSCAGGGVRMRLFVDCCCVFQTVVRGCVPFRLPAQLRGITFEIELQGCSRVTEVRLASSIRELMGDE